MGFDYHIVQDLLAWFSCIPFRLRKKKLFINAEAYLSLTTNIRTTRTSLITDYIRAVARTLIGGGGGVYSYIQVLLN